MVCGVRVGQCVARNGLTTKAHVVQPIGLRTQIDFDVAQGFPGRSAAHQKAMAKNWSRHEKSLTLWSPRCLATQRRKVLMGR